MEYCKPDNPYIYADSLSGPILHSKKRWIMWKIVTEDVARNMDPTAYKPDLIDPQRDKERQPVEECKTKPVQLDKNKLHIKKRWLLRKLVEDSVQNTEPCTVDSSLQEDKENHRLENVKQSTSNQLMIHIKKSWLKDAEYEMNNCLHHPQGLLTPPPSECDSSSSSAEKFLMLPMKKRRKRNLLKNPKHTYNLRMKKV